MPLSQHYKNFIVSCLRPNIEQRATPEFVVDYQWPQAQDYVEGAEQENKHGMHGKTQSMGGQGKATSAHQIIEESRHHQPRTQKNLVHHMASLPTPQHQTDQSPFKRQETYVRQFTEEPSTLNRTITEKVSKPQDVVVSGALFRIN